MPPALSLSSKRTFIGSYLEGRLGVDSTHSAADHRPSPNGYGQLFDLDQILIPSVQIESCGLSHFLEMAIVPQ